MYSATVRHDIGNALPSGSAQLLSYAYQAANGMEHLAIYKIIHRDLALRNLLLTRSHIVKISDFGMSRQRPTEYRKLLSLSPNEKIPIRWMALESLCNGQYTQKSDVWSFAILLWELFSCETPHANTDLKITASALVSWLSKGNRLPHPELASLEMYNLMLDCWLPDPNCRPDFEQCKHRISAYFKMHWPVEYASMQKTLNTWRILNIALQHDDSQEAEANGRVITEHGDPDANASNNDDTVTMEEPLACNIDTKSQSPHQRDPPSDLEDAKASDYADALLLDYVAPGSAVTHFNQNYVNPNGYPIVTIDNAENKIIDYSVHAATTFNMSSLSNGTEEHDIKLN